MRVLIVDDDEPMAELLSVACEADGHEAVACGSSKEAIAHLERLARVPWDEEPNAAPCTGWKTCGRNYEVVEYDVTAVPWATVRRLAAFEVGRAGVTWDAQFPRNVEGGSQ